MHRALRIASALLVGSIALAGAASARNVSINPQAAVTGTNQATDSPQIQDQAKPGYMIGGNARFGGSVYLAPGAYYQRTALEISAIDQLSLERITDVVGVNSVYVPVKLGLNPGQSGFRVYGGPALTIVTSVADNELGITKDSYESSHTGLEAGLGFDVAPLTIDASYEKGLSKVYKNDDSKQDVVRALLGLKF
jgi:hypothetical protein